MKRPALGVFALAVFIGALVALAPATLADGLCALASDGGWRLADARGSLWHGSAQPLRADGGATLPRVHWRLDPGALVRGAIAVELTLAERDAALQARLVMHADRVALAANGRLPAATLAAIVAPAAAGAPAGRLQFAAADLAYGADGYRGRLTLSWHEAGLAATGGRALGSYRLDLDGAGDAFAGRVHTLAGPLQVSGELRLAPAADPGRRLAAELTAQLAPAAAAADAGLAALLDRAGRRVAGGRRGEYLLAYRL